MNRCCATTLLGTRCKNNKNGDNFCKIHNPLDTCSICLCEISDAISTKLSCKHNFCIDCINTWLIEKPSCPYCRNPVNKNELQSAFDYGINNKTVKVVIARSCKILNVEKSIFQKYGIYSYDGSLTITKNDMDDLMKEEDISNFFRKIHFNESYLYYKTCYGVYIPDILYNIILL